MSDDALKVERDSLKHFKRNQWVPIKNKNKSHLVWTSFLNWQISLWNAMGKNITKIIKFIFFYKKRRESSQSHIENKKVYLWWKYFEWIEVSSLWSYHLSPEKNLPGSSTIINLWTSWHPVSTGQTNQNINNKPRRWKMQVNYDVMLLCIFYVYMLTIFNWTWTTNIVFLSLNARLYNRWHWSYVSHISINWKYPS